MWIARYGKLSAGGKPLPGASLPVINGMIVPVVTPNREDCSG